MTITIEVPWQPTAQASPNSRKSTRTKRAHWDFSRDTAARATDEVLGRIGHTYDAPKHPAMDITVYWGAGRQRSDLDNCLASCKGVIDGVTRKLGFDDRRLVALTVAQRRDPYKIGKVVVTIREATDEERRRAA